VRKTVCLEEADAFQHGPSEYLERASRVVDAVVGKEVPHTVGDSGRHFFNQAILPLLPPSAHEIVGGGIGEEFQNVFAVLLKIAVDFDDDVTGRLLEARIERAGLAVVSVEVETSTWVLCRQAIQFPTAVAAIVHEMISNDELQRPHGNS
jgi:hypothetical protein